MSALALTALALTAVITGSAAVAYDPIVLNRGWDRVDRFESGTCTGEVGTNGKFYVISAGGLQPGERAYLTIANGDMRPIERTILIDGRGRWQDYYIPFRFNRPGGPVAVTIAGAACTIPLGFTWRRVAAQPSAPR